MCWSMLRESSERVLGLVELHDTASKRRSKRYKRICRVYKGEFNSIRGDSLRLDCRCDVVPCWSGCWSGTLP